MFLDLDVFRVQNEVARYQEQEAAEKEKTKKLKEEEQDGQVQESRGPDQV